MEFQFSLPTEAIMGKNSLEKLVDIIKTHQLDKIVIITDPGLLETEVIDRVRQLLGKIDVNYYIYSDIEANPSCVVINKCLDFIKSIEADAIISIGGGSSIDAAKAVAAMLTNKGDILDYEGVNKLLVEPKLHIAIPTTAGTGSECTASTVITNSKTLFKTAIISPLLYPKYAILDATLTTSLPPHITASTGMDALTHAIESFVSKQANPVSQALSLYAIRIIFKNLLIAYREPNNMSARENMLIASYMAGVAFSLSRLGNVHAISHTFSGIFNVPHGIANATLLPYVMKFNKKCCEDKFFTIKQQFSKDFFEGIKKRSGDELIDYILSLNKDLNIPETTKELGVKLEKIDDMVNDSMRSGNIAVNPRKTNSSDVKLIIENSFHGII